MEGKSVWRHPLTPLSNTEKIGYHFITESGTFLVGSILVRDFTEVGSSRIDKTYDFTQSLLNEKSQEEGRNV
mgnify:CR=1 FL=1